MTLIRSGSDDAAGLLRQGVWIGLITLASVGFSRAFACAMPFAALATLAALNMRGREAAALMLIVWLVNQAIGFLVLHYPCTGESFEWGLTIGVAALLSLGGAAMLARRLQAHVALVTAGAFAVAFGVYETALYGNALALHQGGGAFASPIVGKILALNAEALGGLLVLNALAVRVRLIPAQPRPAFG